MLVTEASSSSISQRSDHSVLIPNGLSTILFTPSRHVIKRSNLSMKNEEKLIFYPASEPVEYICRICHGGDSSGDLLSPCRCRGSIALAHLNCLEIWLNESNRNDCELCQYHFRVIREPRYSVLRSIFVFLRHPGGHIRELLVDLATFIIYTPSSVTSTYMLMLLCDSIAKSNLKFRKSFLSHAMAFTAIFGIAAINFTYTSWLVLTVEKYVEYWREWYKRTCSLKVVLSTNKLTPPQPTEPES